MKIHPPKVSIDPTRRLVLIEQEHGLLVGQMQKVVVPFAMWKRITGVLLTGEANAEAGTTTPPSNGQQPV